MATVVNPRRKLIKFIFLLAILIAFAAIVIDLIRQERVRARLISEESDLTARWLKAQISSSDDQKIQQIWNTLADKLASYDKLVENPGSVASGSVLVTPAEYPQFQQSNPTTASRWKVAQPPLDVNFKSSLFVQSQGFSPKPEEINEDKLRLQAVMESIITGFNQRPAVGLTPEQYSDRLMEVLEIDDLVKTNLPRLSVNWFYIASDRGNFTLYPSSNQTLNAYNLNKRPWYTTVMQNDPPSEAVVKDSNGQRRGDFGLVPHYPDYLATGFPRTFWHRIVLNKGTSRVTYIVCVDLVLQSGRPQVAGDFIDRLPPVRSGTDDSPVLRPLKVGILSGGSFMILALGFIAFSGTWADRLATLLITRGSSPSKTETGDKFRPVFQAFASASDGRRSLIEQGTEDDIHSTSRTIGAWLQMKVFELRATRNRSTSSGRNETDTKEVQLASIDNNPFTRGLEKWEIFRTQGHDIGYCRLCDQEVHYRTSMIHIGQAVIKHRINAKPDVDLSIDPQRHHTDTKNLIDSIIWQATDDTIKNIGTEYELSAYPRVRVPDEVKRLDFAKQVIDKYRLLNEGRFEADDCVELSKEIFKRRSVRAVCKISYFKRLMATGADAMEALRTGDNVERILIADTNDELKDFIEKNRVSLVNLLEQRNHQLFTISLNKLSAEAIKNYPELDFALTYGQESTMVIVSNVSDLNNRSSRIRGYLSWREVDVKFFTTLYERLKDFRAPLVLEDEAIT